ncbi:hypothetical protein, partial [Sphingomonas sp. CFBP 13706]|uniref:hypothetical protein n=1 Tax=Sphingomonas sp. CFBP 13706 TaxID=2775314 RepID=UPI0018D6B46E
MSNLVMAHINALNMPLLKTAETHGRRLDDAAKSRKVRDEPSLTWVPEGVDGDPLALPDRLADHVAGAFVPEAKAKALHMLVKLPDSVPVETVEQAEAALALVVQFAQDTFGGQAVFSARMDRDERSLNNVDVFMAPRYEKVTKRTSKPAMSLTKHTKALAAKHGIEDRADSAKGSMQAQGSALQIELAAWLTARGFEAARGVEKTTVGNDQVSPEIAGQRIELAKDQAKLADDRAEFATWATAEGVAIVEKSASASAMLDAARVEAAQILADAEETAKADAARIASESKAEADRLAAAAVRDREAAHADAVRALATERKTFNLSRVRAEVKDRQIATQSTLLTAVIAELEPIIAAFRKLSPTISKLVDRDGSVGRMADAASAAIARGRVALSRGPENASTPVAAPIPASGPVDIDLA